MKIPVTGDFCFAMVYHKKYGFPITLERKDEDIKIFFTTHAVTRMVERISPKFDIPKEINLSKIDMVEAWTYNNIKITKLSMKIRYNQRKDITLVVALSRRSGRVVTMFLDNRNEKYARPLKLIYNKP